MSENSDSRSVEPRGWFVGCGSCDGSLCVQNAAVVRVGGECNNCRGWESDPEMNPSDSLLCTELGWCGCGMNGRVDELMLAYLSSADDTPILRAEGDVGLLLAYIADKLEWTEHGGSVYGAWLTDEGKTALANLQRAEHNDGCSET